MSNMDALIDEAMTLGDREVRDLALEIRNRENEHQDERRSRLWNLGDMIDNIKRPYLTFSDIVTVVEAAPDEEAQLQTVMARLAKRGEWDPLVAELAIATVGPQDTDAIVDFLNSLAIEKMDHITTACGKKLIGCAACEEQLPPKDLILASCGHCYCGPCLTIAFQTAVSDESLYPPSCCANTPIPLEHATRFLDSELEWTFEEKSVEFSTVDRTYCSDPTCSAFIPPAEYTRDHALCTKCWKQTCVVCKAPAHGGDCPADLELAALLKYAEEMHWQRCYSCLSVVQRRDGCNHMECRCGASFCYTCGRTLYPDEGTRCPCQNVEPPPYTFYRRPVNRRQPPDSPRTMHEDDWNLPQFDIRWALDAPVPAPIWVGVPEENPVELEQDRSRAGTPNLPDVDVPLDQPENIDNGERASLANSRRSRTPDVEPAQDVTPSDADATLPPVASNADLVNLLRQLVAVVSAQYPVFLNQDQENEGPVSTGPAVLRSDSASDHLRGEDPQHSRSHTSGENALGQERVSDVQLSDHSDSREEQVQSVHDGENLSVYQTSDSSTISIKPTRHGRMRTKLSPRRLVRVLRKAGMSALRRRRHTSPCGDQAVFEWERDRREE
ncbi:hypothetical protein KCU74_g15259, partial [Aureobasidium melanogenum]